MGKPIKLTDKLIQDITDEFVANVRKTKMFDGKINYVKNFKWDTDEKASVTFSAVAFAKMTLLLQHFDSEVAWHGVAYRDENDPNSFYITDILVYPQLVSGSTVNTDQEEYQNWLYQQDDDVFNNIRMQGHSHVNFSTSPSPVDTTHQEKILDQLDDDMFYIFMIWNKKFERTIKIYDLKNNTLYENGEIEVFIGNEGNDLNEFVKGAKNIVKVKPYQPVGYQYGQQYSQKSATTGATTTPAATTPVVTANVTGGTNDKPKNAGKTKEKPAIGNSGKNYSYYSGWECESDFYDRFHG